MRVSKAMAAIGVGACVLVAAAGAAEALMRSGEGASVVAGAMAAAPSASPHAAGQARHSSCRTGLPTCCGQP